MKLNMFVALGFAAVVSMESAAFADPLDDAIKARRAYYQVVKFNAGPLFGMAKGDVAYDAEQAKTFANNLLALSNMANGAMWPEGSDNEAKKGDTRALPAIWATYPAVAEKGKAWGVAVAELAAVAGDGVDALKPKVGAVGKACGACHDDFRAKDF